MLSCSSFRECVRFRHCVMISIIVAVDLTQFTCEEQKQPLVISVGLLSMTRIVLEN